MADNRRPGPLSRARMERRGHVRDDGARTGTAISQTATMAEPDAFSDELLDAVPWARLAHAYDMALDAPAHLRSLAASVAALRPADDAFDVWLSSSVVHQGTPYSATPPALWLARRILDGDPDNVAVGWCLLAVAECATALRWAGYDTSGDSTDPPLERNKVGEPLWATYLPADRAAAPKQQERDRVSDDYFVSATADPATLFACVADWQPTILQCLADGRFPDEAVAAAGAMVQLTPAPELVAALGALVDSAQSRDRRAAAAFALAAVGSGVDKLMQHQERAVRLASALGRPDHPDAVEILVGAIADQRWLREAFPTGFAGPEPWMAAALLTAVLDRVPATSADSTLAEALERLLATREFGPLGATYEWGPVLRWVLPDRWQQASYRAPLEQAELSPLQLRLLTALLQNDDPWQAGQGNASLALGMVGLPHDRAMVAGLLGITPAKGRAWWRRRRP